MPEKKEWAIEKIQMGAVNKFICVWEKSFWDKEVQFLGFTPEIKGKFNFFVNFKRFGDINALMTFTFGEYAKESESLSDQEIIKEIINHLKIMYGNSIPNPISMKRTQWFSDENTYGSYSFATNGSRTTAFDILSKSVNNKLFFAGEHTDRYQKASVHGAYLSGERAAKEIVEVLNK